MVDIVTLVTRLMSPRLLPDLRRRERATRCRRRPRREPNRWARLELEVLEDRLVPTTPQILSVSVGFSQGQAVQLSGSSFGTKEFAKPLLYADFENGLAPSSLGLLTAWDGIHSMAASTEGYGGTRGAEASDGSGNWTMLVKSTDPYWTANSQRFYIFKNVRQNFTITDDSQNYKIWRAWPDPTGTYPDIYIASNNGRVYVEQGSSGSQETGFWAPRSATRINTTDWMSQEMIVQASSDVGLKDGTLELRYDNQLAASGTIMTRPNATPDLMSLNYVVHGVIANPSLWNPGWSDQNRMWVDNVYVDTTWARVVLGDASTYAACHTLALQPPSAWSDSGITVTAQTAGFAPGSRAYLYVFDAAGNVNATGFPVTVGSAAPPPSVTGVSSTATNGTYGIGSVISLTVGFSAAVDVSGTPQLALNSGGTATYSSGSGTNTLTFTYTVGIGQTANPLDEASTTALSLNSGAITDTSGNIANLTLSVPGSTGALGSTKAIAIDTSKPVYTYDSKGRLIGIDYPNGNVYSRTFNSDGSSTATLKNINNVLLYTYNYNVQNQLTSVDYPNGNVLTYTYTKGVLSTATLKSSNGTLLETYNYNAQGQLTSIDYAASGNILTNNYTSAVLTTATLKNSSGTLLQTYNYNSQGQLTSIDYANGNVLSYTYTNGVLSSATLKNSGGMVLDGYTYNAQGQLATFAVYNANGTILTSTYSSSGAVSSATLTTSGGTLLQSYTYNAQGKLASLVYAANGNVLTYNYTSGVLSSATLDASTANGGALLQTYNYNAQGQITSLVYNTNGNTLTFNYTSGVLSTATLTNSSNTVLQTYYYNAAGKVTIIKDGSGNSLYTYTYDSLGRVSTVTYASNGNITTFTYNSDGTSSATYDTIGNTLIATYHYDVFGRVTEIDYTNGNTYKRTYAADGTSTATLKDKNGNTIESYTYDAQGNLISHNP